MRGGNRIKHPPLAERFWSKVDTSGDCWVWKAAHDRYGYGHFMYRGVVTGAHRIAFLLAGGAIPSGHEIDHLCRNRECVRPDHLEAVTCAVNQQRGIWDSRRQCVNGHAYDEANTYRRPNGRRDCRACINERQKRARLRRLAA